jgi:hypothetical protein
MRYSKFTRLLLLPQLGEQVTQVRASGYGAIEVKSTIIAWFHFPVHPNWQAHEANR